MDAAKTEIPALRSQPGTAGDAPACPHCTAGTPPGRLSLRGIAALVGQHFGFERGFLHTFTELVLRPGAMLRAYFDGRDRRRHVNPVSYLLLSAAASLLAFQLYRDAYRAFLVEQVRDRMSGELPASIRSVGSTQEFIARYTDAVLEVSQYTSVTTLLIMLPFGALLWLLCRGPRFNAAEALVLSLYATATALLIYTLLATPLMLVGRWNAGQYGGTAVFLSLPVWIAWDFLGRRLKEFAWACVAMVGGYVAGSVAVQFLAAVLLGFRSYGH